MASHSNKAMEDSYQKKLLMTKKAEIKESERLSKLAAKQAKAEEKFLSEQRIERSWRGIYGQISNPNASGLYNVKRIIPPYDWGYTSKEWATIAKQIRVANALMKAKYGGPITASYPK
jgi:hypothetical protein